MPAAGYRSALTARKAGGEGFRSALGALALAAGVWAVSPEGTALLHTSVPTPWLVWLPVALTVVRAGLDYHKHRNTPVHIGAAELEAARRRYEEGR